MKKVLISLAVMAAVAAIGIGATVAYFSDTEQSVGNTFTAGTIDISVGEQGMVPVKLDDMKPGYVAYSNFTVVNSGTNPVNVTKEIKNIVTAENGVNEPEQVWYSAHEVTAKNDIDTVIKYDLSVKVYNSENVLVWNQTLNDEDKTIAEKMNQPSFLGMIPVGYHMDVVESYHMDAAAENWAQSDTMSFDIVLTGTQLAGTATLSNKDQNRKVADSWFVLGEKTGTLTYGVKDATFAYSFTGTAPLASTEYSLIMFEESFSTPSASAWPRAVVVLGAGTTDSSGAISLSGNLDTGSMLNAKIWLVKTSDLAGSTLNGWHPADYLFDTGMIDYIKS